MRPALPEAPHGSPLRFAFRPFSAAVLATLGEAPSQRCARVAQALARAGVPSREAAIVFASLLRTGQQVAMQGGRASAIPPGVARDNALLEQNHPEIRKLTSTGAES